MRVYAQKERITHLSDMPEQYLRGGLRTHQQLACNPSWKEVGFGRKSFMVMKNCQSRKSDFLGKGRKMGRKHFKFSIIKSLHFYAVE